MKVECMDTETLAGRVFIELFTFSSRYEVEILDNCILKASDPLNFAVK